MEISKLLKEAKVCDSDCLALKELNTKNIISSEIKVPFHRVAYSYTTARGNEKTGEKYIIAHESDWDIVEVEFFCWLQGLNEKYPYKKLSNVKILDISYVGELFLELE